MLKLMDKSKMRNRTSAQCQTHCTMYLLITKGKSVSQWQNLIHTILMMYWKSYIPSVTPRAGIKVSISHSDKGKTLDKPILSNILQSN